MFSGADAKFNFNEKIKNATKQIVYPEVEKMSNRIFIENKKRDELINQKKDIEKKLVKIENSISQSDSKIKSYLMNINDAFKFLHDRNLTEPTLSFNYTKNSKGEVISVVKNNTPKDYTLLEKADVFFNKKIRKQYVDMFYSKSKHSVFIFVKNKKLSIKLKKKYKIQKYLNKKGRVLVMYNEKKDTFYFKKPK